MQRSVLDKAIQQLSENRKEILQSVPQWMIL